VKIGIDLTALADNFSGIERFTMNIAYQLIINFPKDKFVLIFKNQIFKLFKEFKEKENIEIIVLKGKNKLFFSQLVLPAHLYKIKVDYWLFMAFPTPFLFWGKKTITAIHDVGCWDQPKAMTFSSRYFFRILFRKCAVCDEKIITVSEFSKGRIQKKLKIKKERIKVLYNGLSPDMYQYKKEKKELLAVKNKYSLPSQYILCLSTLEPRKNMRLLIKAYSDLWKEKKLKADLVLAGRKGWKIDNLLNSLDDEILEHIHLTGFIEDEDLPTVYHCADVFVFPSIYEGFGIPPLEALAVNTPVISSNSTSLPEVLGEAAIYFENNNLEDLKCKLLGFYSGKYSAAGELPRKYDWKESAKECRRFLEMRW